MGQARAAWNQYLALSPADRYRMQREGQSAPPNPDAATAADAYRAVREGRGAISPREQDIFGAAPATQGIPTGPSTAPPQYLPGQNSALRLVRESAAPATQGGPTGTPVGAMAPIPPGASAPIPPAPGSSAQLAPPQTPPGSPSLANRISRHGRDDHECAQPWHVSRLPPRIAGWGRNPHSPPGIDRRTKTLPPTNRQHGTRLCNWLK